ncbi:cholecystokinin receptor type A [Astyanax mexicanus]|uniref:Gastrin/cholecystokinin type B receptor n=1 Tax=Astyanax mexicanus TaxID=7994 RepID=A0A8B9L9V2_ASTMX|nr:cholecystokinin receptor type A [Astyanax mexicanus]KAG9274359.1 cholecystokinin receptor type A [Astyanax mexicanus]
METFTIHDMLLNGTDIYRLLCGMFGNGSDCDLSPTATTGPTREPKDINQTVRIILYSLIFLLGVLGNSLIIAVLIRNRRMRTVTNLFLLSLAVSDLMLCVFCMPFTLIPNLMENFVFGSGICKTATYFMGISVSVSTFNLVAISLERYSAICNPLTSRTWQTKSHAAKVITATWLFSFLLMLPYPISSTLVPYRRNNNTTGNMCRLDWPSDVIQQSWYVFLLLILFLVPGIVMMTAYGLISVELYRGIKFEMANRKSNRERESSTGSLKPSDSDGCYLQASRKKRSEPAEQHQALTVTSSNSKTKLSRVCSNSPTANLMAKKRVIRMLLVIVVLFFLCWMPVFAVNAWRAFDKRMADRLLTGAPISFIHLLSYTSACVNPIIYCFMNKRFRQGMLATFTCCSCEQEGEGRGSGRLSGGGGGGLGTLACGGGFGHDSGTLTRLTYTSVRGSAQA